MLNVVRVVYKDKPIQYKNSKAQASLNKAIQLGFIKVSKTLTGKYKYKLTAEGLKRWEMELNV